jgi:uncharacterized membrane protein
MKKTLTRQIVVAVLVLAFATGCAGMSTRQQQALSGGAIGAGAGVAIGAIAGAPLTGALIGAGAGGITGALWEDIKKSMR